MIEIRQGGKEQPGEKKPEETCDNTCENKPHACQPKNFRQIGTPQGKQKIYIEDYVYTYLHPVMERPEEMRLCVLVGHVEKEEDYHYIFVHGAVELQNLYYAGVTPVFSERTRETICEKVQQNFPGSYLVGWYLDVKGNTPRLTPELEHIHRSFFGGRDKILLLSDSLNREEKLFACDSSAVWQKEGYYIYYEKNPQMQDYMIRERTKGETKIEPEKVVDEALNNYREILLKKEEAPKARLGRIRYATGFAGMLVLCVLGINMLNNYEKMKNLENAVSVMTNQSDPKHASATESLLPYTTQSETESMTEQTTETEQPSVLVETIKGNVRKLDEKKQEEKKEDKKEEKTKQEPETETSPVADGVTEEPVQEETPVEQAVDPAAQPVFSEAEQIQQQGYYIVQKGENLAAISRKIYGNADMVQAICDKNGIENVDEVFAEQQLVLP
ncbi:MAG: LysM peptidoglycan-binding domain-containing protein [Lachnospiraceae bacterium]|nr:LysM peptidoglycan-binding domain-containing protein [Lachnospiraceae bacterium]